MYQVNQERYIRQELGAYLTCDLVTPSGRRIRDITTRRERLEIFATLLNRLKATEEFIDEFVLDFIE